MVITSILFHAFCACFCRIVQKQPFVPANNNGVYRQIDGSNIDEGITLALKGRNLAGTVYFRFQQYHIFITARNCLALRAHAYVVRGKSSFSKALFVAVAYWATFYARIEKRLPHIRTDFLHTTFAYIPCKSPRSLPQSVVNYKCTWSSVSSSVQKQRFGVRRQNTDITSTDLWQRNRLAREQNIELKTFLATLFSPILLRRISVSQPRSMGLYKTRPAIFFLFSSQLSTNLC